MIDMNWEVLRMSTDTLVRILGVVCLTLKLGMRFVYREGEGWVSDSLMA